MEPSNSKFPTPALQQLRVAPWLRGSLIPKQEDAGSCPHTLKKPYYTENALTTFTKSIRVTDSAGPTVSVGDHQPQPRT